MGDRPRWIKADSAYCEVQRTVDRCFLFRPNERVRQVIGASAGRALKKYPVKLFWLDFNINHKQNGIAPLSDDPAHIQNYAKFHQMFNSLSAIGLNKLFDREGALYSSRNRSKEAVDDMSLEQQLFYAITNVVKDGLVDRVAHWKGFSSEAAEEYKESLRDFLEQYWQASKMWRRGNLEVEFPRGSYRPPDIRAAV